MGLPHASGLWAHATAFSFGVDKEPSPLRVPSGATKGTGTSALPGAIITPSRILTLWPRSCAALDVERTGELVGGMEGPEVRSISFRPIIAFEFCCTRTGRWLIPCVAW